MFVTNQPKGINKVNLTKIEKVEVLEIEIHKLCFTHPEMSKHQFESLKDSLSLIGQQQPLITYRGKVIDGRHRVKALKELFISSAHAVELPRNTRMSDVVAFVKGSETRRHQSKTQMACHAYLNLIDTKSMISTSSQAALEFGVSKSDVSMCKAIAESEGINVVRTLSIGESVGLTINDRFKKYSSIRAIYDAIKRDKKAEMLKPTKSQAISKKDADHWVRDETSNDSLESLALKIEAMKERYEYRFEMEKNYDVAG